jgi:hypothetical protein
MFLSLKPEKTKEKVPQVHEQYGFFEQSNRRIIRIANT